MTIFGYRCRGCGQRYESEQRGDTLTVDCRCGTGERVSRDYSGIAIHRPLHEHHNKTLGMPISDHRQFARELRDAGDRYTQRTGIPTDYQPVDLTDPVALGVTGEGLDSTNRLRVANGQPAIRIPGII